MATGCARVRVHLGTVITGSRSDRARTSSKERLPEPMTTEARSSITGTPVEASTRPTSWRLERWREREVPRPRPPT